MPETPVILVDMDGVLANFDDELLRRFAARHPDIPIVSHRPHFYVADDYPEHKALVRAVSHDEGFFRALPLVAHAHDGWQRLLDLGYHPRICSSPIRANPFSEPEKLAWLDEHFAPRFGRGVVDEAVITSDKHLVEGAVLIDDRPEVRNSADATWQHLVFDQTYNRHVAGPRVNGWLDPRLPDLLAAATSPAAGES